MEDYALRLDQVNKVFLSKVKGKGLRASLRSLARPDIRSVHAVRNLDLAVGRGELLAFIGPNGAGKSTTIKLITGILFPDSGKIDVLGLDPHRKRRELAFRIGTVFGQKSQLWFHLPPLDSFHLLGRVYDVPGRTLKERIDELVHVFEIEPLLHQPVRKLSLGERIRCEMAASLIHRPEILFLDEPTIGLDVVVRQRIRDLIRTMNREQGVTIFLTSHDVGDIEKLCRRAVVINGGEVVWDGTVKHLKYSLLNRRIIDLKSDGPIPLDIPGVRTIKATDYSAKLEVDLDTIRLEEAVQRIFASVSVQDINIANVPTEEIITRIYQDTEAGATPGTSSSSSSSSSSNSNSNSNSGSGAEPKGGRPCRA